MLNYIQLQYLLVILLSFPNSVFASEDKSPFLFDDSKTHQSDLKDSSELKKFLNPFVIVEYQFMKSSHDTYFNGGDFVFGIRLSKSFSLGLGLEYSYCKFHNDNTWNLTHLKILPAFIDLRLNLAKNNHNLVPFFHTSEGISFVNYDKIRIYPGNTPSHVSENGLYFYGGFGILYKINKKQNLNLDIGFKGYHMSFNNFDVNPHGLTLRLGFKL